MSNLPQISEAEFEVMKIVWKYAPISTNEITEKLTQISRWSPKTIQTLIKRLVSKKALTYEKQSRVFVYTPLVLSLIHILTYFQLLLYYTQRHSIHILIILHNVRYFLYLMYKQLLPFQLSSIPLLKYSVKLFFVIKKIRMQTRKSTSLYFTFRIIYMYKPICKSLKLRTFRQR